MKESLVDLSRRQLVLIQRQCDVASEKHRRHNFASQLERASRSINNNYYEGFATRFDGDKIRFFDYAKRSCSEVLSMLEEPWYKSAFPSDEIEDLKEILVEMDRQLLALIRFFANRRSFDPNRKYRKK